MAPSGLLSLAVRWRRAARGLEGGLRAPYLRAEMGAHPLPRVAEGLDQVCAAAEQAEPDARELLIAVVDFLAEPTSVTLAQALREEAAGRSLLSLARLLRRPILPSVPPPSARPTPSRPPDGRVPDYGAGRPLTLGERRMLARRPSRAGLEKLFADPHPMVIRLLLSNPKVVEGDVVRLAAKRPANPEVLAEIGKSPRWAHRLSVRMALVQNPEAPIELSIPLVGLLTRSELRLVRSSTDLPPLLRATANEFLARRPPVRSSVGPLRKGRLQ